MADLSHTLTLIEAARVVSGLLGVAVTLANLWRAIATRRRIGRRGRYARVLAASSTWLEATRLAIQAGFLGLALYAGLTPAPATEDLQHLQDYGGSIVMVIQNLVTLTSILSGFERGQLLALVEQWERLQQPWESE